jgi:hypothetical protein
MTRVNTVNLNDGEKPLEPEIRAKRPSVPLSEIASTQIEAEKHRVLEGDQLSDVDEQGEEVHLPVRTPKGREFIRVNADPEFQWVATLLKDDETREFYFVIDEGLLDPDDRAEYYLFYCVNEQGEHFLWPLRKMDGSEMTESGRRAALAASQGWVRIVCRNLRYRVRPAQSTLPEVPWLDFTGAEVLNLAFQGRVIAPGDRDHRLLLRLEGR